MTRRCFKPNNILKGRATPRRHVSRAHRVNLSWLYGVVHTGGHIRITYINAKHQYAGIFMNGFTNAERLKVLMSVIGLFGMIRSKITKLAKNVMRGDVE